jgi:hypothetical protein
MFYMKNNIILSAIIFFASVKTFAQDQPILPLGTCGIVNVYDAAGNRVKRVYFCNNGVDPYPQRNQQAGGANYPVITGKPNESPSGDKNDTKESEYVDALYPNPTTGKFYVTFSKYLTNANVSITDNTGKMLAKFTANGYKVDFDLSPYAAGVYYVRIEKEGKVITKKVMKQ